MRAGILYLPVTDVEVGLIDILEGHSKERRSPELLQFMVTLHQSGTKKMLTGFYWC